MSHSSGRSRCLLFLAGLTFATGAPAQEIRLGPEFQVPSYTIDNQRRPAVATSALGDFLVAWESEGQDGSSSGVFAQRFSSTGTPVGSEFQVNTYTTSDQSLPSVAALGSGGFVVAWQSYLQYAPFKNVFARRFSSVGTALASEFQVNTGTIQIQQNPAVAASSAGDFVVAWQSSGKDGSSDGVFARRFSSAGVALASEFQVNAYTTGHQRFPAVAASASGDFVVAWESNGQDGSSYGVFARRFSSAGVALASEFQVNAYTTSFQGRPSVAASASGDFVVAWDSDGQDGSSFGIFARRFSSAGVALAGEFQVHSYSTEAQIYATVTADASGDFVVAWDSYQDGSSTGVFARRFSAAGAALASEFQVNSFTTSSQGRPAVAAASSGDFVVAWESFTQDGSGNGVFAQRFAASVLDIDANGSVQALADGLLVLRYLFGFTGSTLVTGAVDLAGCNRCTAEAIEAYLATLI